VSRKKEAPPPPTEPFNNPFGALKDKRADLPQARTAPVPPPPRERDARGPARAVVRYERKGRGGKEVTIVEQLELAAPNREEWLKALKQALGCGGAIVEGALVLQGDQRDRLPALLSARGVSKVIVSR
jgi:translation initiation factor 1